MPRPNRNTAEAFYDVFSDMPLDEQAIALRILTDTHRQAIKLAKPKETKIAEKVEVKENSQGSRISEPEPKA